MGGGQRRAFSGQKARQCVPQCILEGVAVLFTVRKHACAPEGVPKEGLPCYSSRVFLRIIVKKNADSGLQDYLPAIMSISTFAPIGRAAT